MSGVTVTFSAPSTGASAALSGITALTNGSGVASVSTLAIPVIEGHLGLGTWQGIYLWEHRSLSSQRNVLVYVGS